LTQPLGSLLASQPWRAQIFDAFSPGTRKAAMLKLSGSTGGNFHNPPVKPRVTALNGFIEIYIPRIAPRADSPSIPRFALERFREEIVNGIIEVVDPGSVLFHPWALSWFRRRVVAVQEGRKVKVVDKGFVRKLAVKEGLTLEEMEDRVGRMPLKYLGFDLWNGKPAYTKDIIAVLPCELMDALAYKEGYTAVLGKKADEIAERKLLVEDLIVKKLGVWKGESLLSAPRFKLRR